MLLICSLIIFCETINAQFDNTQYASCSRWYLDANYVFLKPLENFSAGGFHNGHGLSIGAYYDTNPYAQKVSFHPGLRINGIVGKTAKDNILLSDPVDAFAKSHIYNAVIDLQLVARLIFRPRTNFSPYLEGYGGWRVVTGQERLRLIDEYPEYEEITNTEIISSHQWNWGGSIGGLIRIHRNIDVDIRLSADYAPSFDYINMDSYEKIGNDLSYDFSQSHGLNYKIQIGFRFKLGCEWENSQNCSSSNNRSQRRIRNNSSNRTPVKKKLGKSEGW